MLNNSFSRIKAWLSKNASKISDALQEPAQDELIKKVEVEIGVPLPDEFKQLYALHNGLSSDAIVNFFYGIKFVPLERTLQHINAAKKRDRVETLRFSESGIKSDYRFNKLRIPIGDDFGTCLLCVDLDPGAGGKVGQIIFFDYDYDVAFHLAGSLSELFEKFADDLESGRYSLKKEALADGNHFLVPERSIDPINWFNSPTWQHIKVR